MEIIFSTTHVISAPREAGHSEKKKETTTNRRTDTHTHTHTHTLSSLSHTHSLSLSHTHTHTNRRSRKLSIQSKKNFFFFAAMNIFASTGKKARLIFRAQRLKKKYKKKILKVSDHSRQLPLAHDITYIYPCLSIRIVCTAFMLLLSLAAGDGVPRNTSSHYVRAYCVHSSSAYNDVF